jgi:hypothetical protein
MKENHAAQIAPAMYPAHEQRGFSGIVRAQFAACVGPAEVAEKIERNTARGKACLHVQLFCPIF